jgi:uncharacterized membrane protein
LALHLLGFVLWMGGAFSVMMVSIAARREDRGILAAVLRLQAVLYRTLVLPGALLTIFSGLLLTLVVYGGPGAIGAISPWLMVMQGAGLLAGVITLALIVPNAAKLTRMDPTGPHRDAVDLVRRRQARLGMVTGLLGLIALVSGALIR